MARKYNRSWIAKKNIIDFNQKQWRQDIGYFISQRKFWHFAMVTRTKVIDKKNKVKKFEIYSKNGESFSIKFQGQNKIINSTDLNLVNNYFKIKE